MMMCVWSPWEIDMTNTIFWDSIDLETHVLTCGVIQSCRSIVLCQRGRRLPSRWKARANRVFGLFLSALIRHLDILKYVEDRGPAGCQKVTRTYYYYVEPATPICNMLNRRIWSQTDLMKIYGTEILMFLQLLLQLPAFNSFFDLF